MCELFVSVAELKREKKQTICQSRKEKYTKKNKVEKKGSEEEEAEGDMTWLGKIERLGQLMAQKIVIIEHLNPTSILWNVQILHFSFTWLIK